MDALTQGVCPNCNLASGFEVDEDFGVVYPATWMARTGPMGAISAPKTPRVRLQVDRCLHCDKTIVWLRYEDEGPDGHAVDTGTQMVYPAPAPRELSTKVPEEIRGLFAEASQCENVGAMRAAGVMYRAAVEELVKAQGGTGGNLFAKIDSLSGKGLSNEIIQDFHEARMLGNDSIHQGLAYSPEEVADVADLIEESVVLLYVQPAERQSMRDARKARREGRV